MTDCGFAVPVRYSMLFSIAVIAEFMLGGVTGIVNGSAAADIYMHDTYFILFESIVFGLEVTVVPQLVGALGAWAVMIANLVSAIAMFWFLLFVRSASLWTCTMLVLSLLIAIPPLNALIHGTHVVVAHSMGSMLGVDTMILLAAMAYLVQSLRGTAEASAVAARVRRAIPVLNLSLALFWLAFLVRGLASGWTRYAGPSSPDFSRVLQLFPRVVLIAGIGLTLSLLWIFGNWARLLVTSRAK